MVQNSENALSDTPVRHAGNTPYRLLDAWRGVAALWVVMLHVRLPSTPTWLFSFSAGGHLGVPMFFVISGYCIANAAMRSVHAPSPLRHFLWARVHRIYPPYLCASLLAVGLSLLLSALVQRHVIASSQIADLNLRHQSWRFWVGALTLTQLPLHTASLIRVFWSLCYEVVFYALTALGLFGALRLKRAQLLLEVSAVLTLGVLIWLDMAGGLGPFPWNLWPQFGLGVLVYQVLAQPERTLPKALFALCGTLIVYGAVRFGSASGADGISSGAQSLFYLGFACVLLLLFRWDSQLARLGPVRALSGVGLFSYSLYLIHLLALGIVTQGLNRIGFIPAHALLMYGLKLVLCIAAGRLFFLVCERPFLDWRQRQLLQRESSPKAVVQ